jgi:uncharacterized RmlC-like cupin family protein
MERPRGIAVKKKVSDNDEKRFFPEYSVEWYRKYRDGIDKYSVPYTTMLSGHAYIPPGHKDRRHYHVTFDAGIYVVKGNLRQIFGPDHDQIVVDVEEGDFVFIPKGEIHSTVNLSETETAEIVWFKPGITSREEEFAGRVWVDPPPK